MQPTLNHQMMGYDRSSTMFSPDCRLLQVEYAKKAVRQGTTSIGIVCKDGVILLSDKRIIEKLIVSKSIEKIFPIDDHIGASATGYIMDGRVLVERSQLIAQQYKITAVGEAEAQIKEILEKEYDEKMDLEEGTKLGLSALKKAFGKDFDMERIDGAYIKTSDKMFKRMDKEYLRKISKKV